MNATSTILYNPAAPTNKTAAPTLPPRPPGAVALVRAGGFLLLVYATS